MKHFIIIFFLVSAPLLGKSGEESKRIPREVAPLCEAASRYNEKFADSGFTKKKNALIALKLAQEAQKLDPTAVLPHVRMGETYLLLDEARQAAICAKRALRLNPKDQGLKQLLGKLRASGIVINRKVDEDVLDLGTYQKDDDLQRFYRKYNDMIVLLLIIAAVIILLFSFVCVRWLFFWRKIFRWLFKSGKTDNKESVDSEINKRTDNV